MADLAVDGAMKLLTAGEKMRRVLRPTTWESNLNE